MNNLLMNVSQISKSFSGVQALKSINFEVYCGEIQALVGENGAGKSTLMNILSGVFPQTSGELYWQGQPVQFKDTKGPKDIGIGMIHQELSLAPQLSVMENVFMGNLPRRNGIIDYKKLKQDTIEQLRRVKMGPEFATKIVSELSVSQQQMVEIAKVLALNAKLLIMDEPTSCLTLQETDVLLDIMRQLRDEGVSIIFISHRMEEVFEIADRITILRDGSSVASMLRKDAEVKQVLSLMVGREYDDTRVHQCCADYQAEPVLKVEHLSYGSKVKDVSFSLYPSEVLFVTGLVGAGRSELVETIFGSRKKSAGTVWVDGKEIVHLSTRAMLRQGMSLVPEGRKIQGIFAQLPVQDNLQISALGKYKTKLGTLRPRKLRQDVSAQIDTLRIKTPSMRQLIRYLSGGNQQKVILGRCLMCKPKILILDEPTNGIDIGAKQEIYKIIDQLAHEGVSIICVSSEMAEVLSLADRAIIMHEGVVTGEVRNDENLTQDVIMQYATKTTQTA